MKTIITIGASSSKNSINKILAEHVGEAVNGVKRINLDLNDYEMPIYSVDKEQKGGIPEKAVALNSLFDTVDGFVVSLAEHNGVYSAAFKNIFDWLSRGNGKVWRDKPMLLLSSSPGERGGVTILDIAKDRFPYMGAQITGSLAFPNFYDNFKEDKITNEELHSNIEKLVVDFTKAL